MTDEAAAMLRVAIFGIVAAVVYWLITYEWLGSFAMLALGLGPGFAGLALLRLDRARAPKERFGALVRRFIGLPDPDPDRAEPLAADDVAVIPQPSIWPFAISLGLAITLTGLIFGAWLLLLGGVFVLWGLWGWVAAANRDTAAVNRDERAAGRG